MSTTTMKLARLSAVLLLVGLFTACSPAAATPPPSAAPAETPAPATAGVVIASAEIVPARYSELSFPVSGPVKEILVKTGERVQAGQTLITLDIPDLASSVAQADAALRAAELDLQYYQLPRLQDPKTPDTYIFRRPRPGPYEPPERRELARAQLLVAQAALQTAQASLAQSVLTAPYDATVTDIRVTPGEMVAVDEVVLVLAGLDRLQIQTTDLGEQRIASVRPGQPASVYIEALDQDFTGQVVRVAPRANKEGGDVYFQVTVALDEQPPGMLWGMSAEVQIKVE